MKEGRQSDLYFLDIEMPEMNGFELAKFMRKGSAFLHAGFSHLSFGICCEGYEVQAFGYIPKNLLSEKIEGTLERFLTEMRKKTRKAYVIEGGSRFERVEYEDIVYMYKDKKNTVFVLMDRQISFRKPLREVFDEVDSDCFMYIERGYVVNIEHIIRLVDKDLELRDGSTLHIGRTFVKKVKKTILHFWKERI